MSPAEELHWQKNYYISSAIWTSHKKTDQRRRLLKWALTIISLLMLFYFVRDVYKKQPNHNQTLNFVRPVPPKQQVVSAGAQKASQGFPVRLKIPKLNVDAAVEYVGVTPKGEMDVPENNFNVGWFLLSPPPGQTGSAVIAGHLNGKNGETGVFANLDKLKEGDQLYVENDKGVSFPFIVRYSRTYDPGYASEVFIRRDGGAYLNLITCDGVWDGTKKSYSKRLVVFAGLAK